jgi:oxygen-independent coproporphyrinogen-3 oxidase
MADFYEGVYIHTPFCLQKCLYCDFASYAGISKTVQEKYVQALCKELIWRGKNVKPTATIYFGGGTPSVLETEQIARMVKTLKSAGVWQHPTEATIEVNPGTVDLAKLKALKALGFDRLSMGVQSLNDRELKVIGRIHTAQQALETIKFAQEAGFKRINADVMTGLPEQTVASLTKTLQGLLATGLEHLSVYSLILEPGTPLETLVAKKQIKLPDEDQDLQLYMTALDILKASPLKRYEISNFAVPGQESQHNLHYWRYRPYLGLGAAAVSFDGTKRFAATESVENYINSIESAAARSAVGEAKASAQAEHGVETYSWGSVETLTPALRLEEYLFMGLRTSCGISLAEAKERFGCDVLKEYGKDLEPYFENGCLERTQDGKGVHLTGKGMQYGNQVFEVFVK